MVYIRADMDNISPLNDAFFLVDADLSGAAVNQEGLVSLLVVMIGYKGIFYVNGIPKLSTLIFSPSLFCFLLL